MLILNCVRDHDPVFVVLAVLMATVGSAVTLGLFRRMLQTAGLPRSGWCFLTAVCAGSTVWVTHFVAILGYQPGVPVELDAVATLASVLTAVVGMGAGFVVVMSSNRWPETLIGGGIVGLAIAAMHYVGMFAYRPQGVVTWDRGAILLSLFLSTGFAVATLALARHWQFGWRRHLAAPCLAAGIASLHFSGMAAFQVTPLAVPGLEVEPAAFQALAISVLLVGLLVVGTGISSYLIDDRMRAAANAQLHRMAFQDPLTGLANRRAFGDELADRYASDRPFTLLLVDVDHFKRINDTHGHAVGDAVLVEATRRMEAAVGERGLIARIGGDELAVLLDGQEGEAEPVARALVEGMARPFDLENRLIRTSCSVGYAFAGRWDGVEALFHAADMALYEAKRSGRNRIAGTGPTLADAPPLAPTLMEGIDLAAARA